MRRPLAVLVTLTVIAVTAGVTATLMVLLMPTCSGIPSKNTASDVENPELWRPLYHFSPRAHWVNDPNGLIYYKGEYHLFYQYNTHSVKPGNMSWGHAISPDLVSWQEIQPAIFADDDEEIFSGSAIVDSDNTTLLGSSSEPAMLAFYTGCQKALPHYQYQSLAYSTDLGRTWTKYKANPLIHIKEVDFRDPKVIRVSGEWIMLVQLSREHSVQFYQSTDLLLWKKVGQFPEEGEKVGAFGGVWECPDMFQLPVDGDINNKKWVLIVNINPGNKYSAGSGAQYFLGDFNGAKFIADDNKTRWLDHGMDYYAAVSFSDVPDERRIMIGWMSNWLYAEVTPTSTWRNGMSIAREVRLRTINGALFLTQQPVQGLESQRVGPPVRASRIILDEDKDIFSVVGMSGLSLDLEVSFIWINARAFGVKVHVGRFQETHVGFKKKEDVFELFVNRVDSGKDEFVEDSLFQGVHSVPVSPRPNGRLYFRLLVDTNSVEVFAGEGEAVITDLVFPVEPIHDVVFFVSEGAVEIAEFQLWKLNCVMCN